VKLTGLLVTLADCLKAPSTRAKAQAGTVADPALKGSYRDLEGRLLCLARGYMFYQSLLQDLVDHGLHKRRRLIRSCSWLALKRVNA